MEQNNLTPPQIYFLTLDLKLEIKKDLIEKYPEEDKEKLNSFIEQVVVVKLGAILCTLNSTAYENIIKVVHEKLNIDDLFENRQKYIQ